MSILAAIVFTIIGAIIGWAKQQLKILSEMAEDHKLPEWYVKEVKRIMNGIEVTA